jgi:hypothetical protein
VGVIGLDCDVLPISGRCRDLGAAGECVEEGRPDER